MISQLYMSICQRKKSTFNKNINVERLNTFPEFREQRKYVCLPL